MWGFTFNNIERPVIVFSDCHETRSNHILAARLTELKIYLITFIPNTTHMSQPLDVALFRKIKLHWRAHLLKHTKRNPTVPVTFYNFPKIYIPVLIKSLDLKLKLLIKMDSKQQL